VDNEQMQAAIQELQDAMVVMAHIEKRQSEWIRIADGQLAEIAEYRRRTEQNLAEITDKLNGLIGYIDGQNK